MKSFLKKTLFLSLASIAFTFLVFSFNSHAAAGGKEFFSFFSEGMSPTNVDCNMVLQRVGAPGHLGLPTQYDMQLQFPTFSSDTHLPEGTITECLKGNMRVSICETKRGALVSYGPVSMTTLPGNVLTGFAFNPMVFATGSLMNIDLRSSEEDYLIHAIVHSDGTIEADRCSCNIMISH